MDDRQMLSRRRFLFISATSTAASLLAACGAAPEVAAPASSPAASSAPAASVAPTAAASASPAPVATAAATAATSGYKEAPMLAELVKAGKLPAVEQRLPMKPMQLEVVDKIGTYGGQWTSGLLGGSDNAWLVRTARYDPLVRWDPEWKDVIPNIAESWDISEDAAEYTFRLREGIKWSDGEPFTAADILFWVNDIRGNEELNPGGQPDWMKVNGKPAEVSAPDDYTVVFKFAGPNSLFLQRLATPDGVAVVDAQAKYAKQWHIAHNPKAGDLAKEAGLDSWVALFQNKVTDGPGGVNARVSNPELPTLAAWRFTNAVGDGQSLNAERNPYYWKVDAEGNQLPYLDGLVYTIVEDKEALILKALNGEIDMMDRHIATLDNKAVFTDNQEKGNYGFFETVPAVMNSTVIALNLTHKDPVKREIFNNQLFRQALSVAINRQEIIDTVYVGQGTPAQPAPRPESEFYDEKMTTQFTEYNIDQAKAWLDEAGYTAGSDGKRVGPDGKPISFGIEVATGAADRVDVMNLVVQYWQALGIDTQVVTEERTLFYTRKENNEHDAGVWQGDGGLEVILEPRWYFPFSNESIYGEAWQHWYNNPKDERAEEPPAEVKKQMELYQQLKASAKPEEQTKLMKQILEIARDNFYVMGISLPSNGYGIVKNDFHNVPATMFNAYLYPHPGPTNPPQYYKDS